MKMAASITLGALSLMLLAFCSSSGGLSASSNQIKESKAVTNIHDDHVSNGYQSLVGGYGKINLNFTLEV